MRIHSFEELNTQNLSHYPGTNAEVFVRGQIVYLLAGVFTKSAATSAGKQEYVMNEAATGDASTLLSAFRIQRQYNLESIAAGTPVVGSKYTLDTAAVGITNTTTSGVFKVTTVLDSGNVIGNFETTPDR